MYLFYRNLSYIEELFEIEYSILHPLYGLILYARTQKK